MFQGLHYGQETVNELRKQKRRRAAAQKKEERKEREQWNELSESWDYVEWAREEVEVWRKELKTRELAVAAREAAVFQRELEYRRLERCPLCGRRGRNGDARRQEALHGVRQDPVHRGGQAVARGVAAGIRAANAAIEQQNEAESRPRAGGLLRRALGQGGPRMADNMNVQVETWGEACAALRMTPQRSPFQCDQAGANVAIHDRLPRRQTPYPRVGCPVVLSAAN